MNPSTNDRSTIDKKVGLQLDFLKQLEPDNVFEVTNLYLQDKWEPYVRTIDLSLLVIYATYYERSERIHCFGRRDCILLPPLDGKVLVSNSELKEVKPFITIQSNI